MIVVSISSAQLDTVDPALNAILAEHGDQVARYLAVLEECEQYSRVVIETPRMGGRLSALSLAFVAIAQAGQSAQRTTETLALSVPAFEEPPRFHDYVAPANPSAPIPDRIRRRADSRRRR